MSYKKLIMRQTYSCLSSPSGFLVSCIGFLIIICVSLELSEQLLLYVNIKRMATQHLQGVNTYSDNIGEQSYYVELSSYLPIDVVYTWVNGSDPLLLENLEAAKSHLSDFQDLIKISNYEKNHSDLAIANNTENRNRSESLFKPGQPCPFTHCTPFNVLVMAYKPGLANALRLGEVLDYANKTNIGLVKVVQTCEEEGSCVEQVTLLKMVNVSAVTDQLNHSLTFRKEIIPAVQAFVTSENVDFSLYLTGYYLLIQNLTNISDNLAFSHNEILNSLYGQNRTTLINTHYLTLNKLIITVFKSADEFSHLKDATKHPNLNLTILPAKIIWPILSAPLDSKLKYNTVKSDQHSNNRFQDNEELRYSLRSLVKYSPWVRNIYIVTNGQIPYWLNLEHPRISIITHKQIFKNLSHLPTFSSPAIESHLHRIPGLSRKFLYMNDDVMFGREVWPDDFYTNSGGQKFYLSWSVPNCRDGCPQSWIGDGYCDSACNNSHCDWDAGDCNKTEGNRVSGLGSQLNDSPWSRNSKLDTKFQCSPGCPSNWLGDRYCDSVCFHLECGFDSGDCGTGEFFRIPSFTPHLSNLTQTFTLPYFTQASYFIFSLILPNSNYSFASGDFTLNTIIRSAVFSTKFNLLTLTFFQDLFSNSSESKTDADIYLTIQNTFPHNQLRIHINLIFEDLRRPIYPLFSNPTLQHNNSSNDDQFSRENIDFIYSFTNGSIVKVLNNNTIKTTTTINHNSSLILLIENLKLTINSSSEYHNLVNSLLFDHANKMLTNKGLLHRLIPILVSLPFDYLRFLNFTESSNGNTLSNVNQSLKLRKLTSIKAYDYNTNQNDNTKRIEIYNPSSISLHKRQISDSIWVANPFQEEKDRGFQDNFIQQFSHQKQKESHFMTRKPLDTFADSLKFVNKLYTKRYGSDARKVPAHMPHLVDVEVMEELQATFPEEFESTSSHQMRHSNDMQFSFSYYYFFMSEKLDKIDLFEVFEQFDSDNNGFWSVFELRNFMVQIYELPILQSNQIDFNKMLVECNSTYDGNRPSLSSSDDIELYGLDYLPLIHVEFILRCESLLTHIKKLYGTKSKHKFEIMNEENIAFKMMDNNITNSLNRLDWIRKNRRKFICINDNINHDNHESALVVAGLIRDLYESLFPYQSQFELSPYFRNKFSHIDEYNDWKYKKFSVIIVVRLLLVLTVVLMLVVLFYDRIKRKCNRFNFTWLKALIRRRKRLSYPV